MGLGVFMGFKLLESALLDSLHTKKNIQKFTIS